MDTKLQIFYTTPAAAVFSKEHLVSKSIKRGDNELLFRLPHPKTAGRIRLDPGMVGGDYILHSLIITRENREEDQGIRGSPWRKFINKSFGTDLS